MHSHIARKISTFNEIELQAVDRFKVVSVDAQPFRIIDFQLNDSWPLLKIFKDALDPVQQFTSKQLFLRTLTMKCLTGYMQDASNAEQIINHEPDIIEKVLNIAC